MSTSEPKIDREKPGFTGGEQRGRATREVADGRSRLRREADAFYASFPEDPAFAPSVERLKTFLQRVGVDTPIVLVTSAAPPRR